jgi:hypothetical protein
VVIVSTLLEEDQCRSCEEIAHEANVNRLCVQNCDSNIAEDKVAAKRVPHQLSEEEKAACKRVAEELLWRYAAEGEQFLNRTVGIDETWI